MARKIAVWLIRLVVAAAVYGVAADIWIEQASGWDKLGRFGAAIGFAAISVPSWLLAILIGLRITDHRLRLALHPLLAVLWFLLLSVVTVRWGFDTPWETLWRDLGPFAAVLMLAMVAEAAVGLVLERWWVATRRPAT